MILYTSQVFLYDVEMPPNIYKVSIYKISSFMFTKYEVRSLL